MAMSREEVLRRIAEAEAADSEMPAHCERCGLGYPVDDQGEPITQDPYTCNDCGGSVESD